jgi:hypothetical protein
MLGKIPVVGDKWAESLNISVRDNFLDKKK